MTFPPGLAVRFSFTTFFRNPADTIGKADNGGGVAIVRFVNARSMPFFETLRTNFSLLNSRKKENL